VGRLVHDLGDRAARRSLRFVDDERRRRVVSLALAAMIVESVISLWV